MGTLKKLLKLKLIINMTLKKEVVIPFKQKSIPCNIVLWTSMFNVMLMTSYKLVSSFKVSILWQKSTPTKIILGFFTIIQFVGELERDSMGTLKKKTKLNQVIGVPSPML